MDPDDEAAVIERMAKAAFMHSRTQLCSDSSVTWDQADDWLKDMWIKGMKVAFDAIGNAPKDES